MTNTRLPAFPLVGELMDWAVSRLQAAELHYGHGTDSAIDEAGALVFHALGIPHEAAPEAYRWAATSVGRRRVMALVQRRIRERVPSAYLTGRTWFAGLEFEVTPAVLIPRSPIAELIEEGFEPWRGGLPVESVLEIGTGSGCIAVACAAWLPGVKVDAVDLSHAALEVAARNVRRHGLQGRVRLVQSDVYGGVAGKRYDIVVSNPPYVPSAEMVGLPPEYAGEPVLALEAGPTGLDVVERIMLGASRHLRPGGLLVVEVGGLRDEVERRWPRLPLTWLQFERGGGDVMLVRAEDCANVG